MQNGVNGVIILGCYWEVCVKSWRSDGSHWRGKS